MNPQSFSHKCHEGAYWSWEKSYSVLCISRSNSQTQSHVGSTQETQLRTKKSIPSILIQATNKLVKGKLHFLWAYPCKGTKGIERESPPSIENSGWGLLHAPWLYMQRNAFLWNKKWKQKLKQFVLYPLSPFAHLLPLLAPWFHSRVTYTRWY